MKRITQVVLAGLMAVGTVACSSEGTYTPGTYTGEAQGFGGKVSVTITVDKTKITDVKVTGDDETPQVGGAALEKLAAAIKEKQSAEIDAVTGATVTSTGVMDAAAKAIEAAKGNANTAALAYTAGTYTGTADGYNGPVSLDVTFSEDAITAIEVKDSKKTAYVGTPAYDILIEDAIAANGSGIDVVSGATFTSLAIKNALNDAAQKASATIAFRIVVEPATESAEPTIRNSNLFPVKANGEVRLRSVASFAISGSVDTPVRR